MSNLPSIAQQAAQTALSASIASIEFQEATSLVDHHEGHGGGDDVDEQVLETDVAAAQPDVDRTVFEDPKTFNVKHPLYSSWTLWYDSPSNKGKIPSTPSTALPQTPSTAAAAGWMEDIKSVISLDSVEEFWGLYNNMMPPSNLPTKANYYLFKEGIIPAWEDPANKDGGKWSIQLPRDKTRAQIDTFWLNTMLAAIGETFDPALSEMSAPKEGDQHTLPRSIITGVLCSARPTFYRISIWTRLAATPSSAQDPPPSSDSPDSEQGDALVTRIEGIGRHFKHYVLGYAKGTNLAGGMSTEVEFISHKDSERKPKGGSKKFVII